MVVKPHIWFKCRKSHEVGESCVFCNGGLGMCRICGCMEGSLLSSCPGYRLNLETEDAICCGNVYDFVALRRLLHCAGREAFVKARDARHWNCRSRLDRCHG